MFACRVQHLSLRYNGITDVGADLLGKALGTVQTQNMKLLSLNLNGNKITDKGAQSFATVSCKLYLKVINCYFVSVILN